MFMRLLKISLLLVIVVLISGCACRKKVSADGNVPLAVDDGPIRDVNFAFDSYALDSVAKSILDENASWLGDNGDAKVQVEGHCDERGTKEYNMALGMNRSRAAMDYLRTLGVDRNRMSTVSYGEELPLDPRHSEEAWAKNRRAHFNVQ